MGLRELATAYNDIFSANGGQKEHLHRHLRFLKIERRLREITTQISRHRRESETRQRRYDRIGQAMLKLHREKQELENIINHDVHTGLLNRRVFNRDIEQFLSQLLSSNRLRHMGLLFVGLDSTFNRIKQTLGYTVSDTLLYITASRIKKCLANLPYRLYQSGRRDEFIIMLESTIGIVECETIAEELHAAISQPAGRKSVPGGSRPPAFVKYLARSCERHDRRRS